MSTQAFGNRSSAFNRTRQATLADDLRIADTHWTRFRGLLGVSADRFSHGEGLWIVPCRGVHTMGMGFPIDVIYLSEDQTVVHLESTVVPWRFTPVRWNARTVLELQANTIRSTGTALGDSIEIHRADAQSRTFKV
jgi:uncharacterized membrane protein (UPF0127 family)